MTPVISYQRLDNKKRGKNFIPVLLAGILLAIGVLAIFYATDREDAKDVVRRILGIPAPSPEPASLTLPSLEPYTYEPEEPFKGEDVPQWFTRDNKKYHWAVLIAGSNGYSNYRHQADVCHAFQIMRRGGVELEQTITFLFDDLAQNYRNPYKGQIFNKPGGSDVYPGCAKDYTGSQVTKRNFLSVLKGDESAMRGIGSGRVVKRDPNNKIFVFYSDHGSAGSISMPIGPALYADELHKALNDLSSANAFDQMLIYLEACEAGSMFRGFGLDRQRKIFAVGAANHLESSYATYCPDYAHHTRTIIPNATHIGSCLGDLFSVSWMENSDKIDRSNVQIREQLKHVRARTSNYGTYFIGSHMTVYGDSDETIRNQVVGNFLSYYSVPSGFRRSDIDQIFDASVGLPDTAYTDNSDESTPDTDKSTYGIGMEQRQADLVSLYYTAAQNDEESLQELEVELTRRQRIDRTIRSVVHNFIAQQKIPAATSVEEFVTKEVVPAINGQVVDDWACLRGVESAWEHLCFPRDDYTTKYGYAFANLCNQGLSIDEVQQTFMAVC